MFKVVQVKKAWFNSYNNVEKTEIVFYDNLTRCTIGGFIDDIDAFNFDATLIYSIEEVINILKLKK